MKNIKYLLFLSAFFVLSCQEEYEAPVSATVNMNGVWWVELLFDANSDGAIDADDILILDYHDVGEPGIVTSNVASNAPDTVMVIDVTGLWPFKGKFPVDYPNLLFSPATGLPNMEVEDESVSVIAGKVIKGGATTLSGGTTDSIFMALEFSDDPGSVYMFSGHRYTGFPEDNH